MTGNWKKTMTSVVIAASLIAGGLPAYAAELPLTQTKAASGTAFKLTELLDVEVKSVLNEKVQQGTRLGVVIKMKNNRNAVTRVPDYELRAKTEDGAEYTLKPSALNPKSIQPKAQSELSYMAVIDRTDPLKLKEINWTDVDYYVYPKKETVILTVPVDGMTWEGGNSTIDDPKATKKWGESFTLPFEDTPLVFKPSEFTTTSNAAGQTMIVKVLVENPDTKKHAVPDFSIDGRSELKSYPGNRLEQGQVYVEPGEKKYIHFAIPTEAGVHLTGLTVVTPETFAEASPQGQVSVVQYSVGRVSILLPQESIISEYAVLPKYTYGEPIQFDSLNKLVDPKLTVSLMELRMYDNEGAGYKTAVAKLKFTNRSGNPIALPAIAAELGTSDGYRYASSEQAAYAAGRAQAAGASAAMGAGAAGSAAGAAAGGAASGGVASGGAAAGGTAAGSPMVQAQTAATQIMPNSSGMVIYSFLLPESESGENLSMKLLDAVSVAPYTSTIAAFKLDTVPEALNDEPISFYPFDVTIKDWDFSGSISTGLVGASYTYRVKLDLDIQLKDDVVFGQDIPKMEVELIDRNGVSMGSKVLPFTGTGKLINGPQTITLDVAGDYLQSGVKIHIYETIQTPFGPVKRQVAQFPE